MRATNVLREAEFKPEVKTYWLLTPVVIFCLTIVLIPLGVLWFVIGSLFAERYLKSLACVLTERDLIIKRGVWFKVEKTIPLEKITDLAQAEGPLLRMLGLKSLHVETAGQSGPGALVNMVGIVDTDEFRDAVLMQRDKISEHGIATASPAAAPAPQADALLLGEIRDSLQRIEALLEKRWNA